MITFIETNLLHNRPKEGVIELIVFPWNNIFGGHKEQQVYWFKMFSGGCGDDIPRTVARWLEFISHMGVGAEDDA